MTQNDQTILVFAFRYALGRMSMAPSIMASKIRERWSKLSIPTKKLIKDEIDFAIKFDHAGMDMDVSTWKEILELP